MAKRAKPVRAQRPPKKKVKAPKVEEAQPPFAEEHSSSASWEAEMDTAQPSKVPLDAPTEDLVAFTAGHFVDLAKNFFVKTRWNRELKLVRGYPVQYRWIVDYVLKGADQTSAQR